MFILLEIYLITSHHWAVSDHSGAAVQILFSGYSQHRSDIYMTVGLLCLCATDTSSGGVVLMHITARLKAVHHPNVTTQEQVCGQKPIPDEGLMELKHIVQEQMGL